MSKKLSKLLAFALSVCMLVGLAPAVSPPAHAADTAIGNAADLLRFANEVNDATRSPGSKYHGNAYMTADIDMSALRLSTNPDSIIRYFLQGRVPCKKFLLSCK